LKIGHGASSAVYRHRPPRCDSISDIQGRRRRKKVFVAHTAWYKRFPSLHHPEWRRDHGVSRSPAIVIVAGDLSLGPNVVMSPFGALSGAYWLAFDHVKNTGYRANVGAWGRRSLDCSWAPEHQVDTEKRRCWAAGSSIMLVRKARVRFSEQRGGKIRRRTSSVALQTIHAPPRPAEPSQRCRSWRRHRAFEHGFEPATCHGGQSLCSKAADQLEGSCFFLF